jgi:hypothetical protein
LNSSRLNNRHEPIIVINTKALFKPFSNEAGFIPIERKICLVFYFEDPFAVNDVMTLLRRDKIPCIVPHESTALLMYHRLSVRTGESFLEI